MEEGLEYAREVALHVFSEWEDECREDYGCESVDAMEAKLSQPERTRCVWIAVGCRFLGTVTVCSDDLPERPELGPWMASLYVIPDARKRGVGSALMRVACTIGGAKTLWVYADAHATVAWYERAGWTVVESSFRRTHCNRALVSILSSGN